MVALIAIFLILLNTVSALNIDILDIGDEEQGDNIYFDVQLALSYEESIQISNGDLFLNLVAKRLCISPRNNNSSGKPLNKNIPKRIIGNCHNGHHSVV